LNLQDGAGRDGGDGFSPTKSGKAERNGGGEVPLSSASVAFICDDAITAGQGQPDTRAAP
jgi:hypothetical protein